MRILFLTPQSPYPPHKGTSTRNYNLIKNVAERHEVHLLTFVEPGTISRYGAHPAQGENEGEASFSPTPSTSDDLALGGACPAQCQVGGEPILSPTAEEELRRYCASVRAVPAPPRRPTMERLVTALFSPTPDLALRLASADMTSALAEALSQTAFDLVQVEALEMAPHWLAVAGCRRGALPPVVLDAHNCEYVLQQRAFSNDLRRPAKWPGALYSFLQWRKLRGYEAGACRRASGVLAVSDRDRAALGVLAPDRPMAVVPNGIDTAYFRPSDTPRRPADLVFTGTMDFRPNVDAVLWFCREVLPLIRAEVPEVRFFIVGQRPKPEVQRLGSLPGVVVTGAVDDVRPYLWQAALCVVPLRVGGGTRFKILEAMACRTPVVSTTLGAEGIELAPGEHAMLADRPAELAGAVVALLRDPERRRSMAERGWAFAAARYGWRVLAGRLLSFYEELRLPGA